MDNKKIADELKKIAKDLVAGDFEKVAFFVRKSMNGSMRMGWIGFRVDPSYMVDFSSSHTFADLLNSARSVETYFASAKDEAIELISNSKKIAEKLDNKPRIQSFNDLMFTTDYKYQKVVIAMFLMDKDFEENRFYDIVAKYGYQRA